MTAFGVFGFYVIQIKIKICCNSHLFILCIAVSFLGMVTTGMFIIKSGVVSIKRKLCLEEVITEASKQNSKDRLKRDDDDEEYDSDEISDDSRFRSVE